MTCEEKLANTEKTMAVIRNDLEQKMTATIEYIDATNGPGVPDPEEPVFVNKSGEPIALKEKDHGW